MTYDRETALLIIDMQVDFCPGGALPVAGGHDVVPVINTAIAAAREAGAPVIATRDWHPVDHCSFREQGGPWPVHCVQDSAGAAFHPELQLPEDAVRVSKGTAFDRDAYSGFDGTGLAGWLRARGIGRLVCAGLAQDVCVRATVLDACREGFDTRLLMAGTRPVDPAAADSVAAELRAAGARLA